MGEFLTYRVDANDLIEAVAGEWTRFALANGGDRLLPPGILSSSIWPWIVDETTRQVYRAMLKNVRAGAGPVRFRFRCDGPSERRLLEMRISLGAHRAVEFETRLVLSQPRDAVQLISPDAVRTDSLLSICGWCMRVQVAKGTWVEVERAIQMLEIFEAPAVPKITHGMCPTCYGTMMASLDDADLAASGSVTVGALA